VVQTLLDAVTHHLEHFAAATETHVFVDPQRRATAAEGRLGEGALEAMIRGGGGAAHPQAL
jgi:hypothetical protein